MGNGKRIIKKEEYFARLSQGIPIGNCWVDMGNGELAYALYEVTVTSVPVNKYNDRTFLLHDVCVCVRDNTYVDTQRAEMKARKMEEAMERERKKDEMKKQLIKIVTEYFATKKRSIPFAALNVEKIENLILQEKRLTDEIEYDDRPTPKFPFELYVKHTKLINDFIQLRTLPIEKGKDTDNWWSNFGTMIRLFVEWDMGIGQEKRTFTDDRVANAFRNAWKVNEARDYFYNKYAGVADLTGASVTNYRGDFGLKGLFKAGIDPIEQFAGSYRIDIYVIEGSRLKFVLTNSTSMKSFLYGIGPEWERKSFRLDGNMNQTYIFTEPIRR
jgi:hypothetical protein